MIIKMAENYIYAVARIRALETSLFSSSVIEQLISCKTYDQCLQLLKEKGWGGADTDNDAEAILKYETDKTWKTVLELVKDPAVFDVLTYPNLFHNLKAAIKCSVLGEDRIRVFMDKTTPSGEEMLTYLKDKNFTAFPKQMQETAKEAYEAFVQTGDGQLCDIIVDQAALKAIHMAGRESKDDIIKQYAESTVAVANIKIAVRAQKTKKSMEFMMRAMSPCDSLSINALAQAALSGTEAIKTYLTGAGYGEAADALNISASAFERWCDNCIIEAIKPQKYVSSGVGPVVAYALARENEIKTVRIALSGVLNGLDKASIGERMRQMYV